LPGPTQNEIKKANESGVATAPGQCLGDEEHKCVKDASEVLAVVDEVTAAIRKRVPIFDENNVLALPCQVCGKGFLQPEVGPAGRSLQMIVALHQDRVPIREFYVDVLRCDVCTNTLHFAPGQPYEMLSRGRRSRVDPQPGRPGVLRW
jgi:hypothetical protein